MSYQFKIDNIVIPTPTEYKFNVEDLSSEQTGRTLDGVMHKDVVAVKDSYECKWSSLSWSDAATLLNAIDGKTEFNFTHADPRIPNQMVTSKFYVGKRSSSVAIITDSVSKWKDIQFTFIKI